MQTLNAPTFKPSGDALSASYSVDFSKDTTAYFEACGTWQGDMKRARSVYIDNYENNFPITVTIEGTITKVPAYSNGDINLNGADSFTMVAGGGAVITVILSTLYKPSSGFTARGNAPANSLGPFNYLGSLNLSQTTAKSSWAPPPMVYCPDNNCLYIYANNGNLIIVDCSTNKIKSVIVPAANYAAGCGIYYKGKIYFGIMNGYICVLNCADNTFSFMVGYTAPNQNYFATSICIHPVEQMIYYCMSPVAGVYKIPLAGGAYAQVNLSRSSTPARNTTSLFYSTTNKLVYGFISNGVSGAGGGVDLDSYSNTGAVQSAITYAVGAGVTPTQVIYDGNDLLFALFASSYAIGGQIWTVTSKTRTVMGAVDTMTGSCLAYCPSNGYVYGCDNQTIYDPVLKGVIGNMPTAQYVTMTYAQAPDIVYFLCQDGFLRWGK